MKKVIASIILCLMVFLLAGCTFTLPHFNLSSDKEDTVTSNTKVALAGTEYFASNDGSYLVLGKEGKDNSFKWYKTKDDLNDNYYAGKYYLYTGTDAFKFITSEISSYGVTEEELIRVLDGNYDKLVVLFVEYSDIFIDGNSEYASFNNSIDKDHPKSISYYGEIDEKGNLNLINMLSANPITFEKVQKETIDTSTSKKDKNKNTNIISKNTRKELAQINFNVPEGYELINSTDIYLLYSNYDTDTGITIYFMDGESLDYTKNYYKDGEDITVKGHAAYKYKEGSRYCCSILSNGGEYIIETEDESALSTILDTIEL